MSISVADSGLSADSRMGEILAAYPGARRALFARFHIGGCQSCAFGDDETLAEVCRRNEDMSVGEVIAHILDSHLQDEKILIDPAELAEELKNPEGPDRPRLLDLRTREEFESVKLPGAELFSNDRMQTIFGAWDKASAIVVYDHTGDRCLDAAAFLIGHGFQNTRALRGGIDAYSREVDPELPRYRIEFE